MDTAKIMQMIEGIKGSLAELESALGEGEVDPAMEDAAPEMEAPEGAGAALMPEDDEEEMPPSLSKFMRG